MDYLKSVVPSQLLAERGSNLVVINPGSANIRMGLAHQNAPISVPHCIARLIHGSYSNGSQNPQMVVQDQMIVSPVTPALDSERKKAYNIIASSLNFPPLGESTSNSFHSKVGSVDGQRLQGKGFDSPFVWTNVKEEGRNIITKSNTPHEQIQHNDVKNVQQISLEYRFREFVCGEEALKISPAEPYCVRRPIRRGHLNVSQGYSPQQVSEDIYAIWNWILNEKLHIMPSSRNMYCAILVLPESFDTREMKEILSVVLKDLQFGSAVVHQEGLAAAFGDGLSTACVVNLGAQMTSIICIEDGVALPTTIVTLPFGGEDIARCLLWIQRLQQNWPAINTDPSTKPMDMLMLSKLKEAHCHIADGELDSMALVHSYQAEKPAEVHKLKLTRVNVPPMGLFFPSILVPEEHPPPSCSWFIDHEDMLEDTLHAEFPRRSDISDPFYPGVNGGLTMWENYPVFTASARFMREDNQGLAEAITSSIMSTGRLDLQRKLFCSIQLIGGVAFTSGLVAAVEERVLHAIPSNEAIDTVEVLQSRTDPSYVSWKGGAILGVLDFGREAWIQREDWIRNGIYVGSSRKYKDSLLLQAQMMWYINS